MRSSSRVSVRRRKVIRWIKAVVRSKIMVIVGLAFASLVLLSTIAVLNIRDRHFDDREKGLQRLTEASISIVAQYEAEAKAGRMTEDAAKAAALGDLRASRYDNDNYFWVMDATPTMIMHPIKPELDGKPLGEMKSPTGDAFFAGMAALVRKDGAGFYSYYWPKPGSDAPVRKVSYVASFAPWGGSSAQGPISTT